MQIIWCSFSVFSSSSIKCCLLDSETTWIKIAKVHSFIKRKKTAVCAAPGIVLFCGCSSGPKILCWILCSTLLNLIFSDLTLRPRDKSVNPDAIFSAPLWAQARHFTEPIHSVVFSSHGGSNIPAELNSSQIYALPYRMWHGVSQAYCGYFYRSVTQCYILKIQWRDHVSVFMWKAETL